MMKIYLVVIIGDPGLGVPQRVQELGRGKVENFESSREGG